MGYNKFKHLPKAECADCIKEHLLPQRACDEIRRQLSLFSNSEQREASFKELLQKQKQISTLKSYEFIREIHYKSPLEQSDSVHLPPMYTVRNFFLKIYLRLSFFLY
jgi:hypothetical protein